MLLDASPHGVGGILVIDGVIVSYFSDRLTKQDAIIHRTRLADSHGQQIWESLCVLIAMRVWASVWRTRRYTITVGSDNMAALVLAGKLKAKGPRAVIAREIALHYAEGSFEPRVTEHVPGVANDIADALSRLSDPSSTKELPTILNGVEFVQPDPRPRSWYRTLGSRR